MNLQVLIELKIEIEFNMRANKVNFMEGMDCPHRKGLDFVGFPVLPKSRVLAGTGFLGGFLLLIDSE